MITLRGRLHDVGQWCPEGDVRDSQEFGQAGCGDAFRALGSRPSKPPASPRLLSEGVGYSDRQTQREREREREERERERERRERERETATATETARESEQEAERGRERESLKHNDYCGPGAWEPRSAAKSSLLETFRPWLAARHCFSEEGAKQASSKPEKLTNG